MRFIHFFVRPLFFTLSIIDFFFMFLFIRCLDAAKNWQEMVVPTLVVLASIILIHALEDVTREPEKEKKEKES